MCAGPVWFRQLGQWREPVWKMREGVGVVWGWKVGGWVETEGWPKVAMQRKLSMQ